jgi:hypothetical protein
MVAGCSTDPNEELVSSLIATVNGTTSEIERVTKTLTDATSDAKTNSKPLAVERVNTATEQAAELKKRATFLQRIKAEIEIRKDSVTKEDREALASKHGGALRKALADLDGAEKKLEDALRKADDVADQSGKDALRKLRDKLQEYQSEFDVLNKHTS